jgi:hypothetical protein
MRDVASLKRVLGVPWRDFTRPQRLAVSLGVVLFLVALAALAWSLFTDAPNRQHLPSYALQSTFVFRIERALTLTVGFALLGVFCARLIAGDLPSGLTARGVEWKGEDDITAALSKTRGSVDDVRQTSENNASAIEQLRNELETLGMTLGSVAPTLSRAQLSVADVRKVNEAHAAVIRIIAEELKPLAPLREQVVQLQEERLGISGNMGQLTERVAKLEQGKDGRAG